MKPDTYTEIRTRLARRRRRFLLVATASLAMLAAALGVSFAGPTGLAGVDIDTSASNDFVYPVAKDAPVPAGLRASSGGPPPPYTAALRYTGNNGFTPNKLNFANTDTNIVSPSWAPVAGAAGSVTTAGDLAVIDASATTLGANFTHVRVTVFITNLAPLQASYSSFAYPLNVYACASACDIPADETLATTNAGYDGDWPLASPEYSIEAPVYVTNTDGFVSFSLLKGSYYVIAMNKGGSFYTLSTAGTLAPQFYFTAQAT